MRRRVSNKSQIEHSGERGDLLLIKHNTRLLVDVSVRRPTAQTELHQREHVNTRPLAVAEAAEKKQKHAKYDELCAGSGLTMVTFVMESYGAKGNEAFKLLLRLANQYQSSDAASAEALLRYASAALSVALQCGNADIASRGVQALCAHELEARKRVFVQPNLLSLMPAGSNRAPLARRRSPLPCGWLPHAGSACSCSALVQGASSSYTDGWPRWPWPRCALRRQHFGGGPLCTRLHAACGTGGAAAALPQQRREAVAASVRSSLRLARRQQPLQLAGQLLRLPGTRATIPPPQQTSDQKPTATLLQHLRSDALLCICTRCNSGLREHCPELYQRNSIVRVTQARTKVPCRYR